MKSLLLLTSLIIAGKSYSQVYMADHLLSFANKSNEFQALSVEASWQAREINHLMCSSIRYRLEKSRQYRQYFESNSGRLHRGLPIFLSGVLRESQDLYEKLIDEADMDLLISGMNIAASDFVFAVAGGEALVAFHDGAQQLERSSEGLVFKLTNAQACLAPELNIYIVRDCPARFYYQLPGCSEKAVEMYRVGIPAATRGNMVVNRDYWGEK